MRRASTWGALLLVGAAVWVLSSNWGPVAAGHPSYLAFYLTALALGVGVTIRGVMAEGPPKRRWVSIVATSGLVALAVGTLWLSPFAAEPVALDVLQNPGDLAVSETSTEILMQPAVEHPTAAVVFHPGARVDARAYLNVLRPLAQAGYQVVVVKEPLGIAFLSRRFTASWIEEQPQIDHWTVGGHSLGGVVAAMDAASLDTDGLLLWASFPASDISKLASLQVVSVYGTADAIATPEDVLGSAEELPHATTFAPIEGGIHSYFGDYGLQPGDGHPRTERATAQSEIASASLDLVDATTLDEPD